MCKVIKTNKTVWIASTCSPCLLGKPRSSYYFVLVNEIASPQVRIYAYVMKSSQQSCENKANYQGAWWLRQLARIVHRVVLIITGSSPTNACTYRSLCNHGVKWHGWNAATKRSAGVTLEVNLRNLCHVSNKAHKQRIHPPWLWNQE